MKNIDNYDFTGKRALVRVDFNVPLNEKMEVTDDTRIRAALPTIEKIIAGGGMPVLMSHLGRPKDAYEEKFSLKHVVPRLSLLLNRTVKFAPDCIGAETVSLSKTLQTGDILLLENLRFHAEEKKGDEKFAGMLAELGDVYVNDAFGTAHRAHASTTIVAKFFPEEKMFGYLIEKELRNLDKVLVRPEKPFVAIMGGAKVSDKILIIENLLNRVDHLIIGGGMVYTFIKARGGKIGNSLVEEDKLDLATSLVRKAEEKGVTLHLPVDNIVADRFSNDADTKVCPADEVPDGWMGLDIGSETINRLKRVILGAKTLLWNGPMGVFEMEKFQNGTREIALAVAEATSKGAFSLVGGGDSVAALNKYNLKDQVSFVSTGGGAMLEYMEGKELPGIKAIRRSS
ncbi:MAG: phosphoglycerate kinase [Chlorobi bacterium]|nr:phosphoglycerate kinase [Chlorobiota bacterium]